MRLQSGGHCVCAFLCVFVVLCVEQWKKFSRFSSLSQQPLHHSYEDIKSTLSPSKIISIDIYFVCIL